MKQNNNHLRYWLIVVAACAFMVALSAGSTSLSFFVGPITTELGYSRSSFTVYYGIVNLVQIFSFPIIGKLFDKIGPTKVIITAGITCTLGLISLSFSTSLVSFYISGALLGLLLPACTTLGTVILINTWFDAKKATIMGFCSAFSGVGGAIFSIFLPTFITNNGWRSAYLLLAVCMFVLTVPVGLVLVKNSPQSIGLLPYGFIEQEDISNLDTLNKETHGVSFARALKSTQFYVLYGTIFLFSFLGTVLQHLPSHLIGKGLKPIEVGGLMSIFMIAMVFAKIIIGFLNDKIGTKATMFIYYGLTIVSFVLLSSASSYLIVAISLMLLSCGIGTLVIIPPLITGKVFDQKYYAAIWSVLATAGALGSAISAPVWGIIYDTTGSYNLGFYAMIGVIFIGLLLYSYVLNSSRETHLGKIIVQPTHE